VVILCCCKQSYGVNPSTLITQYGHSVWKLGQDGLDATPLSIAQTTDGYIWVGTSNGLLRFDGVRFTPWSPQLGEQLKGSNVLNLMGARDGSLYVGTLQNVARITNGRVYNFQTSLYHPGPFTEDAQGSIWMGDFWNFTDANTFCRLGSESVACLGTKDGLKCNYGRALVSDHPGSMWIGSEEGICHWQRERSPELFAMGEVDALAVTRAGALWAGNGSEGEGNGLLMFSKGIWRSYVTREVDGTRLPVGCLLSDRYDSLWIGTNGRGLYKLSAGKLDRFDKEDGLSSNNVLRILEDREGDIWVITDRGVDMFRDLSVISYSLREGLPFEKPFAIAAQHDGTVWTGTRGGLVRFRNNVFSSITKDGLPIINLSHLFNDSQNQLWIVSGDELYQYKDGHFFVLKDPNNRDIGSFGDIVEDRDHQIWASTQDPKTGRGYLLQIAGSRVVERIPLYVPTGGETPSSLAADPRGGLWVEESQHGIFHFLNGRLSPVNIGGYEGQVNMMSADPDGALWVVTLQKGLIRYNNGKAQRLTKESGLPCSAGIAVLDDHVGNHWFYMSCGIIKVPDSELAAWWRDPKHAIAFTIFNVLDGAEPRLSGNSPVMTPDGRIWSENQTDLQVIDTRHIPSNHVVPTVHIEKMVVDHKDYSINSYPHLAESPRDLEIDYATSSYQIPERVNFRYRLNGYDAEWTNAGTRRQAFYTDLRPGHYTFRVIACNNDGVWNLSGTSISFTIPPAWYQTVWFRLLCVVLFALLAYAFYQSRLRRYAVLLKARFDERIEERTRLARDLHDTLLQTLQGSKLVADNALESPTDLAGMREALDLVSQWLERASLEGRAALNSLRSSTTETNDLAAALRDAAESGRIGSSVKVAFVLNGTSRDMHPIVREEIYRIGCEAINNACVHSGGSVVTIELTYTHDVLLSVRDNGKGIEEGFLRFGKDGHFGIRGMRERADRVGAKLSLKTTPDGGTEVTLLVPGSVLFKTLDPLKHSKRSKPSSAGHGSTQSE
jgi:signal transduction histidine kinase/ligand-binding sensor domain-containing protein